MFLVKIPLKILKKLILVRTKITSMQFHTMVNPGEFAMSSINAPEKLLSYIYFSITGNIIVCLHVLS